MMSLPEGSERCSKKPFGGRRRKMDIKKFSEKLEFLKTNRTYFKKEFFIFFILLLLFFLFLFLKREKEKGNFSEKFHQF